MKCTPLSVNIKITEGWISMTMIAALALGQNYNIKSLLISGDSRIVESSESGKYSNLTDMGQKIFNLAPNIIAGFAGNYYYAAAALEKVDILLKRKVASQPYYSLRIDIVLSKIKNILKESWAEKDTSFFFAVHDTYDNKRKLYVSHSPDFNMERLPSSNEPYLIGSDDVVRTQFLFHYKNFVERHSPISKEEYGNCLIMAMKEVRSIDINGIISCYSLEGDGNYTIHSGSMPLAEEIWVVDSEDKQGWSKKVGGKTIQTTSKDVGKVINDLWKENRK